MNVESFHEVGYILTLLVAHACSSRIRKEESRFQFQSSIFTSTLMSRSKSLEQSNTIIWSLHKTITFNVLELQKASFYVLSNIVVWVESVFDSFKIQFDALNIRESQSNYTLSLMRLNRENQWQTTTIQRPIYTRQMSTCRNYLMKHFWLHCLFFANVTMWSYPISQQTPNIILKKETNIDYFSFIAG